VSNRSGCRYATSEPGERPPLAGGFPGLAPDSCLINGYLPGERPSLYQDSNERDLTAPLVPVSLGLPAVLRFGSARRADRPRRFLLDSGMAEGCRTSLIL
jgi:DNA oxidative demethylase